MSRKGIPNWTKEEDDYLEEKWGILSIPSIAKKLGRSINGIKIRAFRKELGGNIKAGSYVTVLELIKAFGKESSYAWTVKRWVKHGFPLKHKVSIKKRIRVVDINDFWKWAENNKRLVDFSRLEVNALGVEPEWVKQKRTADIKSKKFKITPWTKEEDTMLTSMVKSYRYTYTQISDVLNRSENAVKRRLTVLEIKERPVKADDGRFWTKEQENKILCLFKEGYDTVGISREIEGKTSMAVDQKLRRLGVI